MSNYSSQTVATLKEALKSRGLATNGVKADLIARLEEADKIEAVLDEEEEQEEPKEPAAKTEEQVTETKEPEEEKPQQEEPAVQNEQPQQQQQQPEQETATEKPATETANQPATEEKKTISPEELREAAITLLTTKIARSKKFNDEEEVRRLEGNLKRVEKFGVALDSALAKELGYKAPNSDKKFNKKNNYHNGNRHHGRNHKRFKGGRGDRRRRY
ncbi:unnamed protein product [Ambrosiozyma monospora]|uniref:Unnamed protein product n=1 Tax=Ambrosiozyma monospora TaxID=43982 RepID=A0ACB5SZX0_AMBMO|nr:unnamed protein product [Ambrosiozyma monospora]